MLGIDKGNSTVITGKYAEEMRERLKEEHMGKKKKYFVDRPAFSREDVLTEAVNNCLDTMYRASYPPISLEDLKAEAKKINQEDRDKARLFDRHYLPAKIHTAILEDFADAYDLKSSLPGNIEVLKNYFKEPIVDVWIEGEDENDPGHRGYRHPEPMPEEHRTVAEKYLDMANEFFNWNRDINCLYFNVCNVSPCSNRDTVEKWYHENGDPDFKIPEDDYWVDGWDDIDDDGWLSEEETEEQEDE